LKKKNQLTFPTRTLDPPISIVDQAKEIENAESLVKTVVNSKLEVILNQIRLLQEQAREIIQTAHSDMELHKVKCSFQKTPGEIIHLYEKEDKTQYFSLLSPTDWNNSPPHKYISSYRMKLDRSFEKAEF
jgi:hypothetical protein